MPADNAALHQENSGGAESKGSTGREGKKQGARRPKLGLAFGGGAAKGAAHVGVLKVLDEYGIELDMVSGTSIGAFVAAVYACGWDWRKMELLFSSFDMESIFKVRPTRYGMIPADGYLELVKVCTQEAKIEDARIPLRIVAVDLVSWRKVVFDQGEMALAVRASSAIPGVLTPVKTDGMLLADGYLLDNVPAGVLRELGADIVLGVSLTVPTYTEPKNMVEIMLRSLDIMSYTRQTIDADLLLRPIDKPVGFLDMKMLRPCMEMGEAAARAAMPRLLELIAEKSAEING